MNEPTIRARQLRYRRGVRAEYTALLWLLCKAYRPLRLRERTPVGEIDLIVRRGNMLVFVEVKARKTRDDAAYAIHFQNQRRVRQAAEYYLAQHPEFQAFTVRFDAILMPKRGLPCHLKNVF